MARGIDKSYWGILESYLISTNMLSDAAMFSGNDIGFANSIKKGRFAMIDMTHQGHDWRPEICIFFVHNMLWASRLSFKLFRRCLALMHPHFLQPLRTLIQLVMTLIERYQFSLQCFQWLRASFYQ